MEAEQPGEAEQDPQQADEPHRHHYERRLPGHRFLHPKSVEYSTGASAAHVSHRIHLLRNSISTHSRQCFQFLDTHDSVLYSEVIKCDLLYAEVESGAVGAQGVVPVLWVS